MLLPEVFVCMLNKQYGDDGGGQQFEGKRLTTGGGQGSSF
jgi:hypothetical protein